MNGSSGRAAVVLTVRFLSEIALIFAAAWGAASHTRSVLVAAILGIAAAVAVVAVWGLWIAPASGRRLPDPVRLVVELVLFAAASAGLVAAGDWIAGLVLAVVGGGTAVALRMIGGEPIRPGAPDVPSAPAESAPAESAPAESAPAEAVATESIGPAPLRRPRGRDRARRPG
jgi:MFS family permease